jgi:O-antigen ligase
MATLEDPKADYNWDSINGRRQVAIRGIGYMIDYPFFGLGIHNFAKAECFISSKARHHVFNTGIRCTPPHNAYVEAGAETGIGGLLLWVVMIPGAVVSLVKLRRRLPRGWGRSRDAEERFLYLATVYLPVAFVGYSVGSFFLSFAWTDITYLLVATWAGLQLAVEEKLARSGGEPASSPPPVPSQPRARSVLVPA